MSCCGHASPELAQGPTPSVAALVVASLLAVNSMGIALATNLNPLGPTQTLCAHGLLLGFALINLALVGRPLVRALRQDGLKSVAGLFLLGICGALAFSLMSTLQGAGPVYYEIVSILLVIYSVGRALTRMAQKRVQQELLRVTMHGARQSVRRGDGPLIDIAVEDIVPGDAFMVRPGGVIVVDGEVAKGSAFVQTASSTGESQLRRVGPGDKVLASWFCTDATLLVVARQKGDERNIDRVAQHVGRALGKPKHGASPSEKVASIFAPVVVAVAAATFVSWAWLGPLDVALLNALAVCLVACPCAFGFAAPIGLRAAAMRLARGGIILREPSALHALARVNTLVFDKTGTLTATAVDPRLTVLIEPEAWTSPQVLALAAAAQSLVRHPISEAFAPWAESQGSTLQPLAAKLLPACGIEVVMRSTHQEHLVRLGDPTQLVNAHQRAAIAGAQSLEASGHKAVALTLDGRCLAVFALTDQPFVPPSSLVAHLAKRHVRCLVLSGDTEQAVHALGIPQAVGAVSAEQKFQHVMQLQKNGLVCFVGDGINDSTALAAADVAVSMRGGAELASEIADLTLPPSRPETIVLALDVARSTSRLIQQNLAISLGYNSLGMAMAAAGLLNPVAAALLMAASSLTVSLRSLTMLAPQFLFASPPRALARQEMGS